MLNKFLENKKTTVFVLGCSYSNLGKGVSDETGQFYADWPYYYARMNKHLNVVNLALAGTSIQCAINVLLYLHNNFKNFKTILQVTNPYRYTPVDFYPPNKILKDCHQTDLDNYICTEYERNYGRGKTYTVGNVHKHKDKQDKHKTNFFLNYLKHYGDENIFIDYTGSVAIGNSLSDFIFNWIPPNIDSILKNTLPVSFITSENLKKCEKEYYADSTHHFNQTGAIAVAEWLSKETKWK